MANLKNIVYLSEEQYRTLKSTGTLTVGDLTLTYDINTMYVTDDKIAAELIALGERVEIVEENLTQITPDVARALKTPMSAPATTKLVAVDTTNSQEMITIGENLTLENGILSATGTGEGGNNFIYLTGTEEKPINLYTDLELGKGYILNGYIRYNNTVKYNTSSYHIFAYKKTDKNILILNGRFSNNSSGWGANNHITGISVDTSGNYVNSETLALIPRPTAQNKILIPTNTFNTTWSNLSDLTEFSDLVTRVETLESTGGGSQPTVTRLPSGV